MDRVLNSLEMKMSDEYTCKKKGITPLALIEKAGNALYECLKEAYRLDVDKERILVVAGYGNNGGDALCLGTHLLEDGFHVSFVLVGKENKLSSELNHLIDRLNELRADIIYLQDETNIREYVDYIKDSTLIIDGLFGTGLNRNIEGIFYKAIERINQSSSFVFSIDIPSGINGNNGQVAKIAVKADFTGIIQNYKIGNLLNDAKDYHGEHKILDIDILTDTIKTKRFLVTENSFKNILPKRKNNTYKYHYGNILIIGGSKGMTGAPVMSAYAALRSGAGLSTVAVFTEYYPFMQNPYPEIMIKSYKDEYELANILDKKNAVAFGPGLGRYDKLNYKILGQLIEINVPLVIDADGLFYLKNFLGDLNKDNKIIITPHIGELASFLDVKSSEILDNQVQTVESLTEKYGFTIVLKGTCTIIANKEEMYFSNLGNPGMATAGSGDVLTGIITGLIGQGIEPFTAAKLGVHLHSCAGNLAVNDLGEYSLVATDIIKYLPYVIKTIEER